MRTGAGPPYVKTSHMAPTSNQRVLLIVAMAGVAHSFRQALELLVVFWNVVMRDD